MAMGEHQHQPEAAIDTSGKKGKKKPVAREKKPAKPVKKEPEAISVSEERPSGGSDGPRIKVSEFDHCVENHFSAMDTIAELCGEQEDGDGRIDESVIQRFSSSTVFLREWRFYKYEPKTVKFASDSSCLEGKDAVNTISLPQFSSAAVLKGRLPPKAAASLDYRNFVMYVGGPIWALDWCPQVHERTDSLIKCEYIAVSAHPPGSSYHKMGIPLTGRGMVQIWCLVHGTECYEAEPIITSKASSDLLSQLVRPRGSPPGRKKSGPSNLPSQPKRPRGRPKKKQEESSDNRGGNSQLSLALSIENPVGSSNLPSQPKRPRGRPKKKQEESNDNRGGNGQLFQALSIEYPVGSSNLPSQPKRPRGRPKKKQEESNDNRGGNEQLFQALSIEYPVGSSNLPSQPKRPRGRPKKKQEESNDNRGGNGQLFQALSIEYPVGSSNLLGIDGVPKNSENLVLQDNCVGRQSSTLLEVSTCNSEDEVPARKRRVRRKVETKNHVEDMGTSTLTENQEDGSNAINAPANKNVTRENSGEDTLLCNNITENAVLDTSSIEFSIPASVALPRVVLCLAHNGKVVWDLKWKPTNASAKDKHRMGYLAVLLGSGSLEVWEVPFPNIVKTIYSKFSGEGTDPRFVKLKPVFRCSMLKSANTQSIPLTVEWSSTPPYDFILVGCHDGTVALWKFSANSTCEDTRPLLRFSADTVPIRGLAWAPSESDPECENMVLTVGHGGLKFWDLRDPFRPLWDLHPVPRMIYSLDWLSDPRCLILSFDDGTLRLLNLLKAAYDVPVTGKPFTTINQKGLRTYCCTSSAIWSAQVSRQTGMVAYCGADGTVIRFQLTTKAVVKGHKRNQTPHFVCDYLTEEQSTITIHTPKSDVPFPLKKATRAEPLPASMGAILSGIQSNEGNRQLAAASVSENETLAHSHYDDDSVVSGSEDTLISIKKNKTRSKRKKGKVDNQELECSDEPNDAQTNNGVPGSGDNLENLPPRSIALHRVRWNMNLGSERWLCYGGAAGLLRSQEILLSPLDKKLMNKR